MGVAAWVAAGCEDRSGGEARAPAPDPAPAAAVRRVLVYFPREGTCEVEAFPRDVPAGPPLAVVRAALQALLDGPTREEAAGGFRSAIPDTLEILRHRMRYVAFDYDPPHHGRRVEIQSLEPGDAGILDVSFSKELDAYDRGATRVCAIVRQVQETVRQFPEWKGVRIAIDGETRGILQP